jgi:hypothetical protein
MWKESLGMAHRIATWAILIWTAFMAVGIFLAFLGIGGDCADLTGSELSTCQSDAWGRGVVGLGLLVGLWLVVAVLVGIVWRVTRPKETVQQG